MTKTTMPDPVGEIKVDRLGNTEEIMRPFGLDPGYYYLITTDQAEAYADSRVREALEGALKIMEAYDGTACTGMAHHASERIRTLIPEPYLNSPNLS